MCCVEGTWLVLLFVESLAANENLHLGIEGESSIILAEAIQQFGIFEHRALIAHWRRDTVHSHKHVLTSTQCPYTVCTLCTLVYNVMLHQMLHEVNSGGSVWCLLVANQPVRQLLCHKAVWVGAQMIPPVLDQLAVVQSQPSEGDV